ncbi:hypothetical protein FGRMN_5741 [Fusarium graminum]|nr:hypothetical protein FGRMN_5741 [Fusarium graminum]
MPNYQLHITVSGQYVKMFNGLGYKLCFASGVKTGGKTNFNLVAATHCKIHNLAVADSISVQWSDDYSIAASQDRFEHGITLTASTNITDIQVGQSYTLPANWTSGAVNPDSDSPADGFRFVNKTNGAGAVLYRRVNGRPSPIYYSSHAPLPPGTEDLTPVPKIVVWFSPDVQAGTMISDFDGATMIIDLSGRTQIELGFDGEWSQNSANSLPTREYHQEQAELPMKANVNLVRLVEWRMWECGLNTDPIAGATGNLGAKVTDGFLQTPFRERYHDVIVLARSRSPKTEDLVNRGASLRLYAEDNLTQALNGVNVLINTVGPSGHHFKEALLRSIPGSSVKLYFPSEFGVDHYVHNFPHEEWDAKKAHFRLASDLISNISICRVYAGLFLEDSIGPWFGFDTKRGRYEAVGDPGQRTSYTSMYDVGKALAILACQPVGSVSPEVHLSGDSKSMTEIAELMEANGAGRIKVSSVPLESYRASVLAKPSPTPERYLRFLMGEGKIHHSIDGIGNQNDIMQADGGLSTWRSVSQLAKEARGRPWAEAEWESSD